MLRCEWARDAANRVVAAWEGGEDPAVEEVMRALLDAAWRAADFDALVNFVCVPMVAPVVVRVSIRVGPFEGLEEWRNAGYELSAYDSHSVGPGVKCLLFSDNSTGHAVVAASFLFRDDTNSVVIGTSPMLSAVYDTISPSLHEMVDSLSVVGPGGAAFVPVLASGVHGLDVEEWQVV